MDAPAPPRLGRTAILALCGLAMMTISFGTSAPALCARAIEGDFGMDFTGLGVFLGASLWGLVAAILVAGPVADRCGFRWLFAGSAGLQSAGLMILSWASGQSGLVAGAFVVGLGGGVVDALATPIVCAVYPERRVRTTNLLHAFYAIGLIFTVVLVSLLRWQGWDWRAVMRALAVLAVPYGLLVLATPLPAQSHAGPVRMPARRIVLRPAFLVLLAAIALGAMTEIGASSWLPRFVQATYAGGGRESELLGGLGLLLFGVLMTAGRLGTSAFVHRFGSRRLFALGGGLCAVSLAMAALPVGTTFTVAWLAVLGLGVAGFWPTIVGAAGDRFPQAGTSMYSLLAAMGNAGAALGPAFIGAVADARGLNVAMALLAVAPLLVIALMLPVLGGHPPGSGQAA